MTQNQVPRIFHRSQAAAKWARARSRQARGGATYLTDTMARDILERLGFIRFKPNRALIVGEASDVMQAALSADGTTGNVGRLGELDEEQPGPLSSYDLIVHLLGLGMVNDLPGALIHARNGLREGGLFIAAFPGSGSMSKLRQIAIESDGERPAARMHPLVDNRAATGLLERAGFKRQVVDSFPIRVRYPSFLRMINDLRDHGLTRSLTSPVPPLDRQWLARANAAFDAQRESDGKVVETFEILVLTGWRD
ncbi:MAG: methyltransferase [Erythrobacter sp.]|nr:methyltransferase [Erythrobacter sp.]